MTKFWNAVNVELSSDKAICKKLDSNAGASPSKLPVASSKLPDLASNKSVVFSENCVILAVTLDVCLAPISITEAKS